MEQSTESPKKEKVIDFIEKSKKSENIITCDFSVFDRLRQDVKDIVHEMSPRKKDQKGRQPTYDYSGFYVGRFTTGLYFRNIYLKKGQMNRLLADLMNRWPDFNYVCYGFNLRVYLRQN